MDDDEVDPEFKEYVFVTTPDTWSMKDIQWAGNFVYRADEGI